MNIDIYGIPSILQAQDLTNVLLYPDAEKSLLFLYLSTTGCNRVLHLLQKIPGVFCSPFTGRGGPHSRRLVICLSSISPQQLQFLSGVFKETVGPQFAEVSSNTYAQLLLLKVADLSKVFGSKIVKAQDLVAEIIDSILEDVIAIKTTTVGDRVESESQEEETFVNNNNNNRILRDIQPQPQQAKKRGSEDDQGEGVSDKKMKSSGEIIDLTSLSPEVISFNNPRVGMRAKFTLN